MINKKVQKKSFVLFADFMSAICALSDEQAGKLFKLIFGSSDISSDDI